MNKLAATILSLALLAGSGPALAQDDVATLQANNAKLQAELKTVQARLRRAISYSRMNREKLESTTANRSELQARLRRAIAHSRTNREKLESTTADRSKLQARLRRAIAHSRTNRQKLESATADRTNLQARLRRAIAHSRENRKKLESATAGRDQYRSRLTKSIAYNRAERAKLEKQLSSATIGRDHLREKLLGTMKKPGMWADSKLSTLNSSIGGLQGTQVVVNRNKSVTVRVGNDTGLFRTGGTRLSDSGADLLAEIALQLTQHPDAAMTVIGHTDNIPVGEGNRYADNQALSLARAVSAVEFLKNEGVSATQLSAAGYGADFPIADNSSEEGRRMNRRVEIQLTSN